MGMAVRRFLVRGPASWYLARNESRVHRNQGRAQGTCDAVEFPHELGGLALKSHVRVAVIGGGVVGCSGLDLGAEFEACHAGHDLRQPRGPHPDCT
jgi:hypothetical protein